MNEFRYRRDVDGLRAVAVMIVLFFHAGLGFSGGFVGVDVFFVISGFLITGLILKAQESGKFRLSEFWLRRIRRILPASTVMVFVTLVVGSIALFPKDFGELGISAVAQQFMASNIFFWRTTGYFAGAAELKPLLHTWSLAVEEQFYLGYPFLLVFLGRFTNRVKCLVLGLLTILSFSLSEYALNMNPSACFYLLPTRGWEMSLGGLIWFLPTSLAPSRPIREVLSLLSLMTITFVSLQFSTSTRFPGASALVPVLGTVVLIYANFEGDTITARVLSTKPMVGIGLISYSLYLWHWPILVFIRYFVGRELSLPISFCAIIFSFVLAYLSWRFIETPFRIHKFFVSRTRVLSMAFGSFLILLVTGLLIQNLNGIPSRFSEEVRVILEEGDNRDYVTNVSLNDVRNGDLPEHGDLKGKSSCLLWGDSHAAALLPGLSVAAKQNNIKLYQATYSATPPVLDYRPIHAWSLRDESPEFNAAVVDFAITNKVDFVCLVGFWRTYKRKGFEASLRKTVDLLSRAQIKVIFVLDVASQERDIPRYLAQRRHFGMKSEVRGVSNEQHLNRNKESLDIIKRSVGEKAIFVDPERYFVDDQGYWLIHSNGKVLYSDTAHLTSSGSKRLIPAFDFIFSASSDSIKTLD